MLSTGLDTGKVLLKASTAWMAFDFRAWAGQPLLWGITFCLPSFDSQQFRDFLCSKLSLRHVEETVQGTTIQGVSACDAVAVSSPGLVSMQQHFLLVCF